MVVQNDFMYSVLIRLAHFIYHSQKWKSTDFLLNASSCWECTMKLNTVVNYFQFHKQPYLYCYVLYLNIEKSGECPASVAQGWASNPEPGGHSLFPVRACAWVSVSIPSRGHSGGSYQCVSHWFSIYPSPTLSKMNKKTYFLKRKYNFAF